MILRTLYRRLRGKSQLFRESEIVRKGNIIERAEKGEFFNILMDELVTLHDSYLTRIHENPGYAFGAQATLLLTKRFRQLKESRDMIVDGEKVRQDKLKAAAEAEQEQETHLDAGGMPTTI